MSDPRAMSNAQLVEAVRAGTEEEAVIEEYGRRTQAALAMQEAPHIVALRRIAEAIGYGRCIQLLEGWFEEMHPGHKAASDWVAANRHRRRQRARKRGS